MATYKYTDATNTVVHVIDHDGISRMSMLASALPEGTEIEPADPIVPAIPQVVSRFQARAALLGAGLLESVEALMADPETPALAKLAWQDAQEFKRTSPTVAAMAAALGLSEQQLDDLFTQAAGIEA